MSPEESRGKRGDKTEMMEVGREIGEISRCRRGNLA